MIALVVTTISATSVSAGWNEFWTKVGVGYKRNNAWPEPFNEMDAMSVIMPFEAMKQNGWVLHNTIGAEQFREGDNALLISGQQRLLWIARQAPVSRRQVYVVRGRSDAETSARVTAVKEALAHIQTQGPQTTVAVVDRVPPTAPGAWVTKVNRAWLDELPAPKLPSSSAAGTSAATQ